MTTKQDFYDSYHQKNAKFFNVISRNNFTYFEILRFFYDEVMGQIAKNDVEFTRGKNKKDFSKIKFLDVGCGVGTVALYFGSLSAQVKGLDVSQRAIKIAEFARKHLNLHNVEFKNKLMKKGHGDCDLAITSEVIEHVEDEAEFLRNISSHLKKNGLLYLTTPLKENLLYKLGFYKKFDKEVGHLRRYTVASIQDLLQKNGFTILKWRQVEGPLRNLLFTTRLGFIIKFIRGPLVPIFHWFDWVSMKLFGASNILVLARKKYKS